MKIKWIVFFLVLFGILGYVRERFFENMNLILATVYRNFDYFKENDHEVPALMKPMLGWTYPQLYYSKYVFTLLFCALFYVLSLLAIKLITGNKQLIKYLNYSYLILLVMAGCAMLYALFVKEKLNEDEYTFSRWLLGIAQSPLICLILIASSKLYNSSFQNKKTIL